MKLQVRLILIVLVIIALLAMESDAQQKRRRKQKRRKFGRLFPRFHNRPAIPDEVPDFGGSHRRRPHNNRCPSIPHVTQGNALRTDDMTYRYTCQDGYRLDGVSTITCVKGQWTVAPRCVAIQQRCPTAPVIEYSSGTPELSDDGMTITYTCLPGYEAVGSLEVHCNPVTNHWGRFPVCRHDVGLTCPLPPPITYGSYSLLSNNQARFNCNPGYHFGTGQAHELITCRHGLWPTPPTCVHVPVVCSSPPTILNGYLSAQTSTSATYTCNTMYVIAAGSSPVIVCSGGVWPNPPMCVPSAPTCSSPPSIPNGQSLRLSDTKASYTCMHGYAFPVGTVTTINCVATDWDPPPTCVRVGLAKYCGPQPCGDATIQPTTAGSDKSVIGTTTVYNCIEGYRIAGSSDNSEMSFTSECQSNGEWDVVPSCEPKNCGQPPVGTGTVPIPLVADSETVVGKMQTYQCAVNYEQHSAELKVTCQPNGEWTPAPECQPITCAGSDTPTIPNAESDMITRQVGEMSMITCSNQYYLLPETGTSAVIGPGSNKVQMVTCTPDGSWSQPTQQCFYEFPRNCADYAARLLLVDDTNMLPAVGMPTSIEIEPLQDGLSLPSTVNCFKNADNQDCTAMSPAAGAITGGQIAQCSDNDVLGTPGTDTYFCAAAQQAVTYPTINFGQLDEVIKGTDGYCTQKVDWTCENTGAVAIAAGDDNLFIALQTSGQSRPLLYNSLEGGLHATLLDTAITDGFRNGFCDCATGPIQTCNYCECSQPLAGISNTASSISFHLDNENPDYVTSGIAGATITSAALNLFAVTQEVVIGDIICCEG